jgi:hypothetical protein
MIFGIPHMKNKPATRNNRQSTAERNSNGTFAKGNPGKPKGARNKATQAILSLLDNATGQLTEKAIELALQGDTAALRLCMERICPARRDIPVYFNLAPIQNATDAGNAAAAVLDAVASGDLTPVEGSSVMGLVDSYRRILEASQFEQRLIELEALNAKAE